MTFHLIPEAIEPADFRFVHEPLHGKYVHLVANSTICRPSNTIEVPSGTSIKLYAEVINDAGAGPGTPRVSICEESVTDPGKPDYSKEKCSITKSDTLSPGDTWKPTKDPCFIYDGTDKKYVAALIYVEENVEADIAGCAETY